MSEGTSARPVSRNNYWFSRSLAFLFFLVTLFAGCSARPPRSKPVVSSSQPLSSLANHFVVLVDINMNQRKVLQSEKTLAEGVIHKLERPENTFSLVVFGAAPPILLKSKVQSSEAIAAVRQINLGPGARNRDDLSLQLYAALSFALDQFRKDVEGQSLLIITEGNDYPRDKVLNRTIFRAEGLQASCNAAVVTSHRIYAPKAIQEYGFYLRRLTRKTHGRYVEVGNAEKKLPNSIDRLSESMAQ